MMSWQMSWMESTVGVVSGAGAGPAGSFVGDCDEIRHFHFLLTCCSYCA